MHSQHLIFVLVFAVLCFFIAATCGARSPEIYFFVPMVAGCVAIIGATLRK